ncbi:MAG: flagellar hook-length control protein FliK [Thiomonas sp.]|jgi:flagellar hook-length control protein FliK
MPSIAPLVPAAATPAADSTAAATPAPSAAQTPRFADALARAGQSQAAPQQAAGADGAAPAGQQDQRRPTGAAGDAAAQTAGTTADTLPPQDAGALAPSLAGVLQTLAAPDAAEAANTASASGKSLPPAHRKPGDDEAALPPAPPQAALAVLPAANAAPAAAANAPVPQAPAAAAAPVVAELRMRHDTAAADGPTGRSSAQTPAAQAIVPGRPQDAAPAVVASAATPSAGERSIAATPLAAVSPSNHLASEAAAPQAATAATGQGLPGVAVMPPWVPGTQTAPQPGWVATVPPHVASPDWGQAMNQQVLVAAQGQQQFATLHLNPPQLGPLEVHLQLHDGQVQAQFVSPHAVVRQAVEAALPQLRDLFTGAGLALTQTSVGAQGQPGQRPPQGRAQPPGTVTAAGAAPQAASPQAAAMGLRWQQGLVNTYA